MTHTSKIIRAISPAHGLLAVTVRCCNDPVTDMVLTLHELSRPNEEIDRDIQVHRERVEKLHGDHLRAVEHVQRLIQK